jgi:hypothetical protein
MKPAITLLLLAAIFSFSTSTRQQNDGRLKGKHILIFTKNGKGYVHENIAASINLTFLQIQQPTLHYSLMKT